MNKLNDKTEQLISFVKHETEQQIEEIKLKAVEEFQIEKSKLIKLNSDQLNSDFNKQTKQLIAEKYIKISELKSEYKLKLHALKEKIVNKVFQDVRKNLKKKTFKLDNLINEVEEQLKEDYKLFVNKEDIRRDLLEVPNPILGGCIGVSGDGLTICDNSYNTRIETIKKSYMNEINEVLFLNE